MTATTATGGALSCSWEQKLYPHDPYDESASDVERFDLYSTDIANQNVRFAVGYTGPGDFPRAQRNTAYAGNQGHAQLVVNVDRDNEGGTVTITAFLQDGSNRRCDSPAYTVHYPN